MTRGSATPASRNKSLADRVDRDLQDPRVLVPLPGIEGQVVVAELEVGRVEVAEIFQGVVEVGAPSAMGPGESARLEAEAPQDAVRAFQVEPVGLGLAVDVVEMPVRLGVVVPQVLEDRGMMGVGVGADEMRAAVGQGFPGGGETVVVLGHGLVQVGPKAEGRAIGIREGRQPDPHAARLGDGLAQPVDHAAANPRLGMARHPFAQLIRADGPRGPRGSSVDQGGKRIAWLAMAQAR